MKKLNKAEENYKSMKENDPDKADDLKKSVLRNEDWDRLGCLEVHCETKNLRVREEGDEWVSEKLWKSRQRAFGANKEQAEILWEKGMDHWGESYEIVYEKGRRYIVAEKPIVVAKRQEAGKVATGGRHLGEQHRGDAQQQMLDNVQLLAALPRLRRSNASDNLDTIMRGDRHRDDDDRESDESSGESEGDGGDNKSK